MVHIPYRIPNNIIQIAHGVPTCSYILICIIIVDPENIVARKKLHLLKKS